MALWPKGPALGALEPHELLLFDSACSRDTPLCVCCKSSTFTILTPTAHSPYTQPGPVHSIHAV